jgi:hypothetical protein
MGATAAQDRLGGTDVRGRFGQPLLFFRGGFSVATGDFKMVDQIGDQFADLRFGKAWKGNQLRADLCLDGIGQMGHQHDNTGCKPTANTTVLGGGRMGSVHGTTSQWVGCPNAGRCVCALQGELPLTPSKAQSTTNPIKPWRNFSWRPSASGFAHRVIEGRSPQRRIGQFYLPVVPAQAGIQSFVTP